MLPPLTEILKITYCPFNDSGNYDGPEKVGQSGAETVMALLQLQGTAKVKLEKDVKAGEEVEIKTEFEAEQGPVDQLITSRLERDRKADREEIATLKKKLEGGASTEAQASEMKTKLENLEKDLAESKKQEKIEKELRAAGAADLDDAFRGLIRVDATADDGQIKDAVKTAIKQRDEFLKKHGAKPATEGGINSGRQGSSGSQENEGVEAKHAELWALVSKMKPSLKPYVERAAGKEAQIKLMETYKAQGLLEAPAKK